MSTSYAYDGHIDIDILLRTLLTGDVAGNLGSKQRDNLLLRATGGAASITGYVYGDITVSAGDILLAHATDPFQAMGASSYSPGFTVAGSKLKLIYVKNTSPTALSFSLARKSTNGLPIFDAASDAVTLAQDDIFFRFIPAGTAALTTGSNDGLTLTPVSGSPTARVIVAYGA